MCRLLQRPIVAAAQRAVQPRHGHPFENLHRVTPNREQAPVQSYSTRVISYPGQGALHRAAAAAAPTSSLARPDGVLTECLQFLTAGNMLRSNPDAWSDTGLPPQFTNAFRPGVLSGLLGQRIAEVLTEPDAEQPAAAAAGEAAAQPATEPVPASTEAQLQATALAEEDRPPEGPAAAPDSGTDGAQEPVREIAEARGEASDVSMRSASEPVTSSQMGDISAAEAVIPPEPAAEPPATDGDIAEVREVVEQPVDTEMAEVPESAALDTAAAPRTEVPSAEREQQNEQIEIQPEFLEALSPNLRDAAIAAQEQERQRTANAAADTSGAADDAQGIVGDAAGASNEVPATDLPEVSDDEPEVPPIPPDFLENMPTELLDDIQQQHAQDCRARDQRNTARARRRADREARLAGGGGAAAELAELASAVANYSAAEREDFLLTTDPNTLMQLGMAQEAEEVQRRRTQSFEDRMMRAHQMMNLNAPPSPEELIAAQAQAQAAAHPRSFGTRLPTSAAPPELQYDKKALEASSPPVSQEDISSMISSLYQFPQLAAQNSLMRLMLNLTAYRQTRRPMFQMLVLFMVPEARHSPLLRDIKYQNPIAEGKMKAIAEALNTLARQSSGYAQELAFLKVPWPLPEDKKGKGPASGSEKMEPSLHVLLRLLGSETLKTASHAYMPVLVLLESILAAVKPVRAPQARPGKRPRPGELETLPEDSEGPVDLAAAGPSDSVSPAPDTTEQQAGSLGVAAESSSKAPGLEDSEDAELDRQAIKHTPHSYLQNLVDLLGSKKLANSTAQHVTHVTSVLAEKEPELCAPLMKALRNRLDSSGNEALGELGTLATGDVQAFSSYAGSVLLHILKAIEKLRQHPEAEEAWQKEESLGSQYIQLEPLWIKLSDVMTPIEEKIQASQGQSWSSRSLSAETYQLLPYVEAFFTLCEARTASKPLPEAALLRVGSTDLARSGSPRALPSRLSGGMSPAMSRELPQEQREALDAHLPLIRFAEQHKVLLNAFIKQRPALLESSFAALLKQPRLIDFDAKKQYFKSAMASHKERASQRSDRTDGLRLNIRRDHLLEDSFRQLNQKSPADIKTDLKIHFAHEEGADMGGLKREWFQILVRELFNAGFGIFAAVPEGSSTFQPNPNSIVQSEFGTTHLDYFRFAGRLVGKAMFDGQTIDAHFTRSMYKHMLSQPLTYEDLEAVDPDYFKSLGWVLENDVEAFMIDETFTTEVDYFGRKETIALKPGGKDIKLTEANKREYVDLKAQLSMTTAISEQLKAFLGGFWDIIPKDIVKIFNDKELELLISGLPEIDVEDMKANTLVQNFSQRSPMMHWFWEVTRSLDSQDLALLVQFITGTSKVPLDGFKALMGSSGPQKLTIISATHHSSAHLPVAHTCFNQLELPEYDSKEQLRERLLVAIRTGYEGFGFQ